jgi:hypothetical protein
MSMKNSSDTIGIRSRGLLVCSSVSWINKYDKLTMKLQLVWRVMKCNCLLSEDNRYLCRDDLPLMRNWWQDSLTGWVDKNAEKPPWFQAGIQKLMSVTHGRSLVISQNINYKYWVKLKPSLMYGLWMKTTKCKRVIVAVEDIWRNKLIGSKSCKFRCMCSRLLALKDAF